MIHPRCPSCDRATEPLIRFAGWPESVCWSCIDMGVGAGLVVPAELRVLARGIEEYVHSLRFRPALRAGGDHRR